MEQNVESTDKETEPESAGTTEEDRLTPEVRQKIEKFQEQWDLLTQRLSQLKIEKILENTSDGKFRLEASIKQIETEKAEVEQELDRLEPTPSYADQRLRQKHIELEKQWAQLSERLSFLGRDKILETDTTKKFRLEQQIGEYQKTQEQIERELYELGHKLATGSPGESERLRRKIADLEQLLDLLSDKSSKLEENIALETDPSVKFRLEHSREEAKTERKQLEHSREKAETERKQLEQRLQELEARQTGYVQLVLEGDLNAFSEKRSYELINVIASLLDIDRKSIRIIYVLPGSIRVIIEMLNSYATELVRLWNAQPENVNQLRQQFSLFNINIITPTEVAQLLHQQSETPISGSASSENSKEFEDISEEIEDSFKETTPEVEGEQTEGDEAAEEEPEDSFDDVEDFPEVEGEQPEGDEAAEEEPEDLFDDVEDFPEVEKEQTEDDETATEVSERISEEDEVLSETDDDLEEFPEQSAPSAKPEVGEEPTEIDPNKKPAEHPSEPSSPASTAITLVTVPQPPQDEHRIRIDIGDKDVTLTFNNTEYKSPIKLNVDVLANEEELSPRKYGKLLFEGIIRNEGSKGYKKNRRHTTAGYEAAMKETQQKLRIGIRVKADSEYWKYKWEYLTDPDNDEPLAVNEHAPFYRLYSSSEKRPVAAKPIKFLFAICNPVNLGKQKNLADLISLDVEMERDIIERAMQPLVENKLAEYEILGGPEHEAVTLDLIRKKLQENRSHVLHVLAHGVELERKERYALVMEAPDRRHQFVYAEDFNSATFHQDLRLIVLAACQSGNLSLGEKLQVFAPHLIEKGIPAVIAMQARMPVKAAQIFTQRFYGDLARSGRIDMAMAATRHDLYLHRKNKWDWGIPILLMSNDDGKLFDVDEDLASTVPRPALEEIDIRGYDELKGQGDPAPRRLAQELQSKIRLHGYGQEQSLISGIRTLLIPTLISQEPESKLFTPGQKRSTLETLGHTVTLNAKELQTYVKNKSNLELPDSTFEQLTSALNSDKHVILIGPPGTGKTTLAQNVCDFVAEKQDRPLNFGTVLTTATASWTTFDTIGGYVPAKDQTLQFRPGIFLEAISAGKWLVIDEINRAEIDKAFGELFTVLSGQHVDLPYMVGDDIVRVLPPVKQDEDEKEKNWIPEDATSDYHYVIHPGWRIIGTMNVYDRSSLFSMSLAFMRRFAFVDVDLPKKGQLIDLINKWLSKPLEGIELDQDQLEALRGKFEKILDREDENPLMERRALGPAIILDMINYIKDRNKQEEGKERLITVLGEAFLLYVVPQLDQIDHDGILKVYWHIEELFSESTDTEKEQILSRIRSLYPHVHQWDKQEI